jgi:hypothetical protein
MGAWATGAATATPAILAGDAVDNATAPTVITDEATADTAAVLGSLAAITGAAGSGRISRVSYNPNKGAGKRYVRLTLTIAGNAGAAPVSAAVLTKPYNQPVP